MRRDVDFSQEAMTQQGERRHHPQAMPRVLARLGVNNLVTFLSEVTLPFDNTSARGK